MDEDFIICLQPPPLRPPLNKIDAFFNHDGGIFVGRLMSVAASGLLVVLILWHVGQAFLKRLWLLPSHPSRLLALNAGTLALLSIVAKPPKPSEFLDSAWWVNLLYCAAQICTAVGAFMPSIAASTDLRDMWSTVVAVGLLIISANFLIFLEFFYCPYPNFHWCPVIVDSADIVLHKGVMGSLFLLLLVLIVQAMALEAMMSDVKASVLEQLEQLNHMEAKPACKANILMVAERQWSWEVVEHNTCIKLRMVVTSNPQHVMARSPSAAIVGALALCNTVLSLSPVRNFYPSIFPSYVVLFLLCDMMCLWRWARVALQEDRPVLSLLSAAEPSYWRRKVKNFQHMLKDEARPFVIYEEQQHVLHGFKEVAWHTTTFLMFCFVIPFHRLLVALTRFTHILSALFMQKLICLPVRALRHGIFILIKSLVGKERGAALDTNAHQAAFKKLDSQLGVVCLEGEDARIVWREFASAVDVIIRKQLKRARTKTDLKALMSLLQRSKNTTSSLAGKSACILNVLHQDSAPYIANLHVEHGYQYGWSLTVVSLLVVMTKIEAEALGAFEVSEMAMDAYWQAIEMMQMVDEQYVPCIVCSKDTYTRACMSEWSKLLENKQRWLKKMRKQARLVEVKPDVVDQVLKAILEPTEKHMAEFSNTRRVYIAAAWPLQTVVAYTMHTVCRSLLKWWTDLKDARAAPSNSPGRGAAGGRGDGGNIASEMIKAMVEHINLLMAEIVACCLSNLPTALDMSMTEAVLNGSVSKIERGLFLVGQGKYLWGELQWPTLHSSPTSNGLGQLRQWIHLAEIYNYATDTTT